MTRDELDRIAVEEGANLGGTGSQFAAWDRGTCEGHVFDWRVAVVGSEGCGNRGRQVLLPTNKRTFLIFREGRIRILIRNHGISRAFAEKIFDACKGVQYSYEKAVLETVIMWGHDDAWLSYPGEGHGVNRWKERNPKIPGLSAPRLDSVAKIIRQLKVA